MGPTDAHPSTPDDVAPHAAGSADPGLTDPELISRVRDGDVAAYGELFSRHLDAATRLARLLVNGPDADDLVSEAFVKVLNVLLGGGGPDVAFRAYLLTAVRRLHVDKVRSARRTTTTDDLTPYDSGVPFTDTAVAGFEGGAAAKAFASLPERWQMVLWHLEVENQKPAEIAPLLGMSPNSVSALAYRAREGLRQAFLTMHSGDLVSEDCRATNDLLGAYVRGALSRRDTGRVETHLEHCRRCTAVYLELSEVNSSLAGLLAPALLGTAAAAYVGGSTAGLSGLGTSVLALLGRGREATFGHLSVGATTAVVAAGGLVAATVVTVVTRGPHEAPSAGPPAEEAGTVASTVAEIPAHGLLTESHRRARAATAPGSSPFGSGGPATPDLTIPGVPPGATGAPTVPEQAAGAATQARTASGAAGQPLTGSSPAARPTAAPPGTSPRDGTTAEPSQSSEPGATTPAPPEEQPARPERPTEPAPPAKPSKPAKPAKPPKPPKPPKPAKPAKPDHAKGPGKDPGQEHGRGHEKGKGHQKGHGHG